MSGNIVLIMNECDHYNRNRYSVAILLCCLTYIFSAAPLKFLQRTMIAPSIRADMEALRNLKHFFLGKPCGKLLNSTFACSPLNDDGVHQAVDSDPLPIVSDELPSGYSQLTCFSVRYVRVLPHTQLKLYFTLNTLHFFSSDSS